MQSLEEIPELLGDYLGITEASAQILLSIIVLLAIVLPIFITMRDERAITIAIIMLFMGVCFLVGIGWLDFWILIVVIMLIALGWAQIGAKGVTGGS